MNSEKLNIDAYRMVGVYGEIVPVLEMLGIRYSFEDNTKGRTSIRGVDRNGKLTLAADGGTGAYYLS